MAEFKLIDKDKYRVVGALTENDINVINAFKNRTILILDNTVGLSSELISKIVSDRVVFSIKGGLDYEKKKKYKDKKYIDRTLVTPSGLTKIIKYFEYNESMIDPNWNEYEKAMFLYNALVVDMEYDENYETIYSPKSIERGLNGILYGKLVCAGFAEVYKEMLDRIGIKNYYQNRKNHHDWNVIEIDGKKYGLDITFDNNRKNNGKCTFSFFGSDPEFYAPGRQHQLFEEVNDINDFEGTNYKVYDEEEELFDLSLLSNDKLQEFYNNIARSIDSRKSWKYNLQEQSLEIKNKYLPIDTVSFKLNQEATREYPIIIILNFLKNRNALQVVPKLIDAFNSRKGYVMDIAQTSSYSDNYLDLSLIGLDNYNIDSFGYAAFDNDSEKRHSSINGIDVNSSNMSQEELNKLYNFLNQYLNQYFNKYILYIIDNLNSLLANYEYKPDEWDSDRSIESANIETKLSLVVKSRDYLIQLGMSEEKINNIIQKINTKYNEIHKPYEKNISQKANDLDFLFTVFNDLNMVLQTMEYDLKKQISEEEFISLYTNVDYMISLFEKYITIAENKKFNFEEYNITKNDLQQLLNNIIQQNLANKQQHETSKL